MITVYIVYITIYSVKWKQAINAHGKKNSKKEGTTVAEKVTLYN